jgi:hypothetical protein
MASMVRRGIGRASAVALATAMRAVASSLLRAGDLRGDVAAAGEALIGALQIRQIERELQVGLLLADRAVCGEGSMLARHAQAGHVIVAGRR